jgi:hypothetical protein
MLLFFPSHDTKFWTGLVLLFTLGLGYLGFKLTKDFIGGYLKANIGSQAKSTLFAIHGLALLILALILPNNFLVDIDPARRLYDQSGLWIAASIVILLFVFLLLFGSLFTLGDAKDLRYNKR